jgi:diketogulonate reductase-like aldo/keto reductase
MVSGKAAFSAQRCSLLLKLAAKHRKTPAQIILRWHIDHGLSAIPKSVRSQRIAENIAIFHFKLDNDEIAIIDALDTGARAGANPETVNRHTFNIKIED